MKTTASTLLAVLVGAWCLTAAPVLALFEGSKYVVHADPGTYPKLVEESHLMWVTMWYGNKDDKSKVLAKLVEEAAAGMHKYGIRFAAVDADAHAEFAERKGAKGLPGLTMCNAPPMKNPYTGAVGRQTLAVMNPDLITEAKLIKQLVAQQMPADAGLVTQVSNMPSAPSFKELLKEAAQKQASHAAVYVSKKGKSSPLVKSVAMQHGVRHFGGAAVGEVLGVEDASAESLAKQLGVKKAPAFVLVPTAPAAAAEGGDAAAGPYPGALVLGGNPSFEDIAAFIEEHVTPAPPPSSQQSSSSASAPSGGGGGSSASTSSSHAALAGAEAVASDAALQGLLATGDALVVLVAATAQVIEEQTEALGPLVAKAQAQGKTRVAVVNCTATAATAAAAGSESGAAEKNAVALCAEVTAAAAAGGGGGGGDDAKAAGDALFLSFAHGPKKAPGAAAKEADDKSTLQKQKQQQKPPQQHASLKKAFAAATASLPTGRVARLDPQLLERRIAEAVNSDPPRIPVVLLTTKDGVPALMENAAEEIGEACMCVALRCVACTCTCTCTWRCVHFFFLRYRKTATPPLVRHIIALRAFARD